MIAQAEDGRDVIQKSLLYRPDVVLMNTQMRNVDGIAAMERISEAKLETKVIFLSDFESERKVLHALRRGARGYLLKDDEPGALIASIVAVHTGERVVSHSAVERVLTLAADEDGRAGGPDGLTAREIEVLKLLARGHLNKQIADRLRISEKTVRNCVSRLYKKIDVAGRSQAALYAVRKGLVEA